MSLAATDVDHVEPAPAQFMDKPRCHRASFNPDACIIPRMPPHSLLNRFRLGMTLTAPEPATGIVDHTD
jgi:hypothetical protein